MTTTHPLFGPEWWVDFQQEWNRSRHDKDSQLNLTGIGIVVSDQPDHSVSLAWDLAGRLSDILPYSASCTFSTFVADQETWVRLLSGDVPLIDLLRTGSLSGRMKGDATALAAAVPGFQGVFQKLSGG